MRATLSRLTHIQNHLASSKRPTYRTFRTSTRIMANFTLESKYRMNSGYEIPVLGYGVYQTPAAVASEVVQHALQTGYRHVDSAVAYRNEAPSAEGMKKSGIARSELFFTTKVPPKELSYDKAKQHIDNSLRETGFDYIDLYLLHAPYGGKENRLGAWKALVEGVEAGKIRSIGVSNFGVHHLEELEAYIKDVDEKEGKGKGGVLSVNQVYVMPRTPKPSSTSFSFGFD